MNDDKFYWVGDQKFNLNTYYDLLRKHKNNYLNYLINVKKLTPQDASYVMTGIDKQGDYFYNQDDHRMSPMGNMQMLDTIGASGPNFVQATVKQKGKDIKTAYNVNSLISEYYKSIQNLMPKADLPTEPAKIPGRFKFKTPEKPAEAAPATTTTGGTADETAGGAADETAGGGQEGDAAETKPETPITNPFENIDTDNTNVESQLIWLNSLIPNKSNLSQEEIDTIFRTARAREWDNDEGQFNNLLQKFYPTVKQPAWWVLESLDDPYVSYKDYWNDAFNGEDVYEKVRNYPESLFGYYTLPDGLRRKPLLDYDENNSFVFSNSIHSKYNKAIENILADPNKFLQIGAVSDVVAFKILNGDRGIRQENRYDFNITPTSVIDQNLKTPYFILPGQLKLGLNNDQTVYVAYIDGVTSKIKYAQKNLNSVIDDMTKDTSFSKEDINGIINTILPKYFDKTKKEFKKQALNKNTSNSKKPVLFGESVSEALAQDKDSVPQVSQDTIDKFSKAVQDTLTATAARDSLKNGGAIQNAKKYLKLGIGGGIQSSYDPTIYQLDGDSELAQKEHISDQQAKEKNRYINSRYISEANLKAGFTNVDITRLAGALFDFASAGLNVTGYTPAAAVTGLVGTGASIGADIFDPAVTTGETVQNAVTSLGLDALSLIPYFGAESKAAKALGTIGKNAGKIMAIAGAAAQTPAQFNAVAKLVQGEKMTADDYRNLINLATTLTGFGSSFARKRNIASAKSIGAREDMKGLQVIDKAGNKQYIVLESGDVDKVSNFKTPAEFNRFLAENYGDFRVVKDTNWKGNFKSPLRDVYEKENGELFIKGHTLENDARITPFKVGDQKYDKDGVPIKIKVGDDKVDNLGNKIGVYAAADPEIGQTATYTLADVQAYKAGALRGSFSPAQITRASKISNVNSASRVYKGDDITLREEANKKAVETARKTFEDKYTNDLATHESTKTSAKAAADAKYTSDKTTLETDLRSLKTAKDKEIKRLNNRLDRLSKKKQKLLDDLTSTASSRGFGPKGTGTFKNAKGIDLDYPNAVSYLESRGIKTKGLKPDQIKTRLKQDINKEHAKLIDQTQKKLQTKSVEHTEKIQDKEKEIKNLQSTKNDAYKKAEEDYKTAKTQLEKDLLKDIRAKAESTGWLDNSKTTSIYINGQKYDIEHSTGPKQWSPEELLEALKIEFKQKGGSLDLNKCKKFLNNG